MKALAMTGKIGLGLYTISALIPLLTFKHWFIRGWDFPRLQLLAIGLGFGALYWFSSDDSRKTKLVFASGLAIGAGLDLYRILPYSPVWPKETLPAEIQDPKRALSIVTVNVLQDNDRSEDLLRVIRDKHPDVVFVVEVDQKWIDRLSSLEKEYPHQLKRPQDNTYGLALYSRLPLEDAEVRFLVEPGIPSVRAKVVMPSGDRIEIFGLHPRPPKPDSGPTTERDAELIIIARDTNERDAPVVVMGDLNDVAWSHTTRLFRRISRLLDPRVGRSPYPTFPANVPIFRFPLDYVFHSDELRLKEIERLDDIGSDHFPMYASFSLEPGKEHLQKGESPDEGDHEEARETLEEANVAP